MIPSLFIVGCAFFGVWETPGSADGVKIVAHRGAMTERPENTMAAFERALEAGADIIELDVRRSSDGHPFILHDARLDRTTDAAGPASERTLRNLQSLDAGNWFDERFAEERIPTLAEVLRWSEDRTTLLLDLKEFGPAFADAVAEEVRRFAASPRVVVGVRSPEQAREFRERLPDALLLGFIPSPDEIEAFAEAEVEVIRLWAAWVERDPSLVDRVRSTGRKLMINGSLGDLEETRFLLRFRPDWILVDDPASLRRSLDALGPR